MQIFVILCMCILICIQFVSPQISNLVSDPWETFKNEYSVSFVNGAYDEIRRDIFLKNKRRIDAHNELYDRGLVSYKLGMNKFGYLEDEEISTMMTGYRQSSNIIPDSDFVKLDNIQEIDVPPFLDWREFGAVTDVKDQGPCGSCWAFSSTGTLEGQLYLKTGQLVSLSEQNLVDCAVGNSGCKGGWMVSALQHVKDHGIELEETYSFEQYNTRLNSSQCCAYKCRYKPQNGINVGIQKIVNLPSGDEDALRKFVSFVGPIAVGIVAEGDFHFYKEGIYFKKDYNSTIELNHAVLVVGYGMTMKGEEYWVLKNSWGKDWGTSGYMRLARNRGNNCGIATAGCYPALDMSVFFDTTNSLTKKDHLVILT